MPSERSATQSRLGAGGANRRCTRSAGRDSGRVGDRGALGLAAHRTGQTQLGHQPLDGAAGHRDALTVEHQPHLARPVHPVVCGVDTLDRGFEAGIADLTPGRCAVELLVVRRRGDLNAELGQARADRLDTPSQTIGAAGGPDGRR